MQQAALAKARGGPGERADAGELWAGRSGRLGWLREAVGGCFGGTLMKMRNVPFAVIGLASALVLVLLASPKAGASTLANIGFTVCDPMPPDCEKALGPDYHFAAAVLSAEGEGLRVSFRCAYKAPPITAGDCKANPKDCRDFELEYSINVESQKLTTTAEQKALAEKLNKSFAPDPVKDQLCKILTKTGRFNMFSNYTGKKFWAKDTGNPKTSVPRYTFNPSGTDTVIVGRTTTCRDDKPHPACPAGWTANAFGYFPACAKTLHCKGKCPAGYLPSVIAQSADEKTLTISCKSAPTANRADKTRIFPNLQVEKPLPTKDPLGKPLNEADGLKLAQDNLTGKFYGDPAGAYQTACTERLTKTGSLLHILDPISYAGTAAKGSAKALVKVSGAKTVVLATRDLSCKYKGFTPCPPLWVDPYSAALPELSGWLCTRTWPNPFNL